MADRFHTFRTLFQGIVLATAAPVVGCSATVTPSGDAAVPEDRVTPEDRATPEDRVMPVDRADCTPQRGPDNGCSVNVVYPCGDVPRLMGGAIDCSAVCSQPGRPGGFGGCNQLMTSGVGATVQCISCVVGRRVDGFAPADACDGDAVGRFYASISQLEAASVLAFEQLARELAAYGAPASLIDQCLGAADDERRHARDTRQIAVDHGATVAPLPTFAGELRSLRAMALDNATEGCVRETFGALVGTWQAAHARDNDIARVMRGIAIDETRHASISWAVSAWLDTVLDDALLAEVRDARVEAARGLLAELEAPVEESLVRDAGMPPPHTSLRLARAMFEALPIAA